ncbi:MAG TPA: iron-sulfur cluster assembly scaffold protein [Pirellulales bacterium]|nr:iron-sulfur cluster assembly scaffold protein [Pirellulales bacterium]
MPSSEDELYQEHILEHYEEPYHRGRVAHATHSHEDDNPLCGDVVRIDLAVDAAGKIQEVYFDGDGCCISQAAASMLVEHFDQKTVEEVKHFTAEDMLRLFGAKLTPNRQKCCLLSWRVLQAAIYSPSDSSASNGADAATKQASPGPAQK